MAPKSSPIAVAAVIAAALGVCAVAASAMLPPSGVQPWVLAAAGAGVLITALLVLWTVQRRRDRSLW